MSGVAVEIDAEIAARALGRLTDAELETIVYEIGALVEDQTKLRISDEKISPDGDAWSAWSEAYAGTRKSHHSLLVDTGNPGLLESVQNYSAGLEAMVGTNLIYGAIHQFGSEDGKLPARAYLGLSADNRAAIEELVAGRVEELLQ